MPNVVAGFDPNNLLLGMLLILRQISRGEATTENVYPQVVKPEGNLEAQRVLEEVFEVATVPWRGIGRVRDGGYKLREAYRSADACAKFDVPQPQARDIPPGCNCHLVMVGKLTPPECKLFRTACTPLNPVGPCMVSYEGTCQIYYKYGGETPLES
jgi:hydrogenase expression/formation protein HypD